MTTLACVWGTNHTQGLDSDGSGKLEQKELCAAARMIDGSISVEEMRFFLAFCIRSDSSRSAPASSVELQLSCCCRWCLGLVLHH